LADALEDNAQPVELKMDDESKEKALDDTFEAINKVHDLIITFKGKEGVVSEDDKASVDKLTQAQKDMIAPVQDKPWASGAAQTAKETLGKPSVVLSTAAEDFWSKVLQIDYGDDFTAKVEKAVGNMSKAEYEKKIASNYIKLRKSAEDAASKV
jgi:hypothetical protein